MKMTLKSNSNFWAFQRILANYHTLRVIGCLNIWLANPKSNEQISMNCLNISKSNPLDLISSFFSDVQILLAPCVLLGLKLFCINLFGFFLENGLNQDSSVLELVALWSEIEFVVQSAVNLFRLSILFQQSSQYSLSSHP